MRGGQERLAGSAREPEVWNASIICAVSSMGAWAERDAVRDCSVVEEREAMVVRNREQSSAGGVFVASCVPRLKQRNAGRFASPVGCPSASTTASAAAQCEKFPARLPVG
jgi:hypothetical protein